MSIRMSNQYLQISQVLGNFIVQTIVNPFFAWLEKNEKKSEKICT